MVARDARRTPGCAAGPRPRAARARRPGADRSGRRPRRRRRRARSPRVSDRPGAGADRLRGTRGGVSLRRALPGLAASIAGAAGGAPRGRWTAAARAADGGVAGGHRRRTARHPIRSRDRPVARRSGDGRRAHGGERDGARDRRCRPRGRAAGRRGDDRGPARWRRPAVPREPSTVVPAPALRRRSHRVRAPARRGAAAVDVPGAQPGDRRVELRPSPRASAPPDHDRSSATSRTMPRTWTAPPGWL